MVLRFDDMLATVLALPLDDPAARAAAWRQIVDLLAQAREGEAGALGDEARDMVRHLRAEVPADVRAEAARAIVGRRLPPSIVALIGEEPAAIAAPLITGARLDAAAWLDLLPAFPPASRALLRHRRDLPREVLAGLASFGTSDFALPASDITVEEPANDRPQGGTQIRELLARIAAYRRGEAPIAPDSEKATPEAIAAFRFETEPDGILRWISGAPRGPLIGETIAAAAESSDHGVDGHAAGAFRKRQPFRDARLSVAGDGPVSGEWRISAVPFFAHVDGRFQGYRGTARRPRPGESAASPRDKAIDALGVPPDSLRQLVHELRTPLNAIVGFGEMIERQMLGPAAREYRDRASEIVHEGRRLLGAVEDLDMAARIETSRLAREPAMIDAALLLSRLQGDYEPAAAARGARIATRIGTDLPLVSTDPIAGERMVARLLASAVGLAGAGETIDITLDPAPEGGVRLLVSRPARLDGRDERALLDPGYGPEGDWPDAPLLGLGFSLRLIRNLATAAGGALDIMPQAFQLRLPGAADVVRAAGDES